MTSERAVREKFPTHQNLTTHRRLFRAVTLWRPGREKQEPFEHCPSWDSASPPCGSLSMADEVPLREAVAGGPSTLRLTATSTPQTAVDACWSVICKGSGRTAKAMRKYWCAPDLRISTGTPTTNGETSRVSNRSNNSRKCEAGLDVARHLLPVFRSARPGVATMILIERASWARQVICRK